MSVLNAGKISSKAKNYVCTYEWYGKTQLDHFNSFFWKTRLLTHELKCHIIPTIRKYIVFGFARDFSSINDWQSNITPNLVSYHLLVSQKIIILSTIIYLLKPKKENRRNKTRTWFMRKRKCEVKNHGFVWRNQSQVRISRIINRHTSLVLLQRKCGCCTQCANNLTKMCKNITKYRENIFICTKYSIYKCMPNTN